VQPSNVLQKKPRNKATTTSRVEGAAWTFLATEVSALASADEGETPAERDGVSAVVRGQSTWTSRPSGRINENDCGC
jgi:hypothetical protein